MLNKMKLGIGEESGAFSAEFVDWVGSEFCGIEQFF